MEESKVLESAIKSCKQLQSSLFRSINEVRRLNIRYNIDWLLQNYNTYVSNIYAQYQNKTEIKKQKKKAAKSKNYTNNLVLATRSSHELCGNNRKINFKFIKIKRSIEAVVLQLQRTIEISNRQKNFIHFSRNGLNSKTRICCH